MGTPGREGGVQMIAAVLVTVLGLGMGAFGLLDDDMYVIGALVAFIGAIGVLVRAVEWLRWLRT